jgi:hypothetical protein
MMKQKGERLFLITPQKKPAQCTQYVLKVMDGMAGQALETHV